MRKNLINGYICCLNLSRIGKILESVVLEVELWTDRVCVACRVEVETCTGRLVARSVIRHLQTSRTFVGMSVGNIRASSTIHVLIARAEATPAAEIYTHILLSYMP